jgi:hypothetical protein
VFSSEAGVTRHLNSWSDYYSISELSTPSDAKLTELASALAPDTEFGANSDFFVPELFDIQPTLPVRESTDLSAPEDDPSS